MLKINIIEYIYIKLQYFKTFISLTSDFED